ncbi:hypothetical protein VOI54_00750 [Tamlana sp. 2201CG12-4]|uniref:helix-turn-helix transcriptional regulator n=1 Tax=Tamlana sp. 2201CG12-4 TaxID=3112582 RepID=UPI002DB770E4|nr:hypothetical protein [Tamlana sp. 2201CG12-4]MEC3905536.1 hypothetical protein [Tamlana sp. 2201CG12-4]
MIHKKRTSQKKGMFMRNEDFKRLNNYKYPENSQENVNPKFEKKNKRDFANELSISTNNMHLLQKRYKNEFKGQKAIYKENVDYIDFSHYLFKKVNYGYYKSYLKLMGGFIIKCNLDITVDDLKLVLCKIFQRNVYIPYRVKQDYYKLGNEIDIIIEKCIDIPLKRKTKKVNKVIYNPKYKLSKSERVILRSKLTGNNTYQKTEDKIQELIASGITKRKDIAEKLGISTRTIRRHLNEKRVA